MKQIKSAFLFITTLTLTFSFINFNITNNVKEIKEQTISLPKRTYTNGDGDTYYQNISSTAIGDNLLRELQSLNSSKRKKTVGYSSMGTSPSGQFKYTDYDPATVEYDTNNQPFGTRILSFYSGNSTTSWNREHVWPNSRGGGTVDNDIHMPRPTIPSENGSRGNSFYVEGMKSSSEGWDPNMESFGVESYRGDSARIVFYCVVANPELKLVDKSNDSTGNKSMGKLSDLLKWNLQYPVTQREKNRNEGAQYLQGNRNPFIDDPMYACRIWGNTNENTKKICGSAINPVELVSINIDQDVTTLGIGSSLNLTYTLTPANTTQTDVEFSSSDESILTVTQDGSVTANKVGNATIIVKSVQNPNIFDEINITVLGIKSVELEGVATKTVYKAGESFDASGLSLKLIFEDDTFTKVPATEAIWSPAKLAVGDTEVTYQYGSFVGKYGPITVEENTLSGEYTLVESTSQVQDGATIIFGVPENNVVAGDLSGSVLSSVNATFSNDTKKLLEVPTDAKEFTLNSNGTNYTFTTESGKLGETSTKKLAYDSGTTNWNISIQSGKAIVSPEGKSSSLEYNKSAPRFTTYESGQTSISLYIKGQGASIEPAALSSIKVQNMTTEYFLNDVFSFDGECIATYEDGSSSRVVPTSISSPNMEQLGEKDINISYTEHGVTKSTNYKINVIEKLSQQIVLSSISVSGMTTEYIVDDTFSFDGVCTATYSDGSFKEVTPTTVSEPDMKNVGSQTVKITYEEGEVIKSTSYQINIAKPSTQEVVLTSITLTGMTTEFQIGNTFVFDGVCTATYSDGSSKIVTPTSVSRVDTSAAGTVTVTVSYTENNVTKSANYIVTIKALPEKPNTDDGCSGSIVGSISIFVITSLTLLGVLIYKKEMIKRGY